MDEKTLKFENITVNKKKIHKSKHPNDLSLANVDRIVVPDKFKHNDECFKYFIVYKKGKIVKPLCIILPQMNGYIKYFDNSSNKIKYWINITKFGMRLKINWVLNFIVSLFMIKIS